MIDGQTGRNDNTGLASPLSTVYLEEPMSRLMMRSSKDDWVMLINQDTSKQVGFQHQLAFCRVVGFSNGDGVNVETVDHPRRPRL